MFPIVFVDTLSNVAPTTPPTSGIALPRLIAPFCPNLVISLNPTALFIAFIVSPEIFFY